MKYIIDHANSRGHANHEWLESYHTFSFAGYYNPHKIHFGALRVLNDDRVIPGKGFDMHKHQNMEILSIPLLGHLKHQDSMGNTEVISPGMIQVMSAGTGITHGEFNDSLTEFVEFLQIWIIPKRENTKPRYNDYNLKEELARNKMLTIIAPDDSGITTINQYAWVTLGFKDMGEHYHYKLHGENMGAYMFVIHGQVEVDDNTLNARDGIGITDTPEFFVEVRENAYLLIIEVPMIELK